MPNKAVNLTPRAAFSFVVATPLYQSFSPHAAQVTATLGSKLDSQVVPQFIGWCSSLMLYISLLLEIVSYRLGHYRFSY